jgi:transcriptional regulator with XRE-family HTH domain
MAFVRNFEHTPPMDLETELGLRIRAIRQSKGMSQQELANRTGSRRTHLNQIENGKFAARIDTLYSIAKVLEVSLAYLLTNVG